MAQISNEIEGFRCSARIKYIESIKINDRQIETLYAASLGRNSHKEEKSA
ncbi:MAG: hypothetical protein ACYDG2_10380 [Ruminiclostridium sp.]